MIFWALTLIVTIKYILFVLRADNDGEGGVLSLMALTRESYKTRPHLILGIGIVGASFFYGDAVITPAISVLSAIEGLENRHASLHTVCRSYNRHHIAGALCGAALRKG